MYRLFLTSIIIAMKFHEEYYIENAYFFKHASKYCYIYDIRELNQLERAFLEAIDYRLKIEPSEQQRYFDLIYNKAQELQCKQFKVYTNKIEIIEDYFWAPKTTLRNTTISRRVAFWLNGKIFKNCQEVYHFFQCDEICEDKTAISDDSTLYTDSEGSPKLYFNLT